MSSSEAYPLHNCYTLDLIPTTPQSLIFVVLHVSAICCSNRSGIYSITEMHVGYLMPVNLYVKHIYISIIQLSVLGQVLLNFIQFKIQVKYSNVKCKNVNSHSKWPKRVGAQKGTKLCAADRNESSVYRELQEICLTLNIYLSLFSSYQLNAHFLYSITIYMFHYNPQHVSNSTLLIFKRTNCIITASGIFTLCKRPYNMPVESGLSPLSTGILYRQ